MIKLIWAMDPNGVIGINQKLPWHIKEEFDHFRKTTKNQTILVGRKTFEGLLKVLPNRKTIILTRNKNYKYSHKDVSVINDINNIIYEYGTKKDKDIYICGGSEIYKLFYSFSDQLIASLIYKEYKGDSFFPYLNFNKDKNFKLIKIEKYNEYKIEYYDRV